MKALVVHGAGDLRFDDLPAQAPEPGQVLVRNTHGGICGSDLHYYKHGAVGAFALREPLVLGHEVVGRIENDPSGALATGTPVAIHPATPAKLPGMPRRGPQRVSQCPLLRVRGQLPPHPGRLLRIHDRPAGPDPGAARHSPAVQSGAGRTAGGWPARAEPGRRGAGAKVLVGGSGPIGILAAGAAKAAGAAEVWTTDLLDHPLKIALDVGVDRTVRIGSDTLPDQYFDVAIEASGASVAVGATLAAVRRRGVVVQLGMFPPGPRPAELSALVAKEIDYRGAFRFDTEFDESIALLAGSTALDPVITHSFDLIDAVAAMDVSAEPATSSKVVLRLSDD